MLYRLGRALFRAYFLLILKITIEGLDNIPRRGGVLIVANHANFIDPPLVGVATPRPVHFMAKTELFDKFPGKTIMYGVQAFPVKRGTPDRNAIRTAVELLQKGRVVGLFPEGTRSGSSELKSLRGGAALIALKSGATVVPAGLIGSHLVTGPRLGKRWPVRVRFGPAEPMPDLQGERVNHASLDEANRRIQGAIRRLLDG